MSMVRFAVRAALVNALRGNTLVQDNVLDSKIGVIDVSADFSVRTSESKPFIGIYVDAAQVTPDGIREIFCNGDCEIVLEFGMTSAMAEVDEQGQSTIASIGIPVTDEAMEFQLDLVAREIMAALSDPENVWSEYFKCLVSKIKKIERSRVGFEDQSVRLAAHQIKITAALIDDPLPNSTLIAPFDELLPSLVDLGGTWAVMANVVEAHLLGQDLTADEYAAQRLGQSKAENAALGLPGGDDYEPFANLEIATAGLSGSVTLDD